LIYIYIKLFTLEKILALHNIKTVGFTDNRHVERKYAFTNKMSANNTFIEYYTIDGFDAEEQDPAQTGHRKIDEFEPEEQGSRLSVIMEHKNKYYELLMFHNTVEIGSPIILLQTIIFLVKLIEDTEPDQLVDYLADVSTDPLIPHQIREKEFSNVARMMIKTKVQTVQHLIQQDNAISN